MATYPASESRQPALSGPRRPSRLGGAILTAITSAILIAGVAWPGARAAFAALGAAARLLADDRRPGVPMPSVRLCAMSVAWAGMIAAVAVALAWMPAWWIRRRGWVAAPWLCVPLLMPSYLAYAGLGMLRAPGTLLGDRLEALVGQGWPDAPVLASKVQAVAGLALWVWPIAAMVLAAGLFSIDVAVYEHLRLDARSRLARQAQYFSMMRRPVAGAFAASALVMLGSAVPLHLAEAPTVAVKTWLDMTLHPGDASIWLAAWPNLLAATIAAYALRPRVARHGDPAAHDLNAAVPGPSRAWIAGAVVALSTLAPTALLAFGVSNARAILEFWTLSGPALAASAAVAAAAATGGVVVAVWVWYASSSGMPRLVRAVVLATLLAGLLPGVLIGKAVAEAYAWAPGLADSAALTILGHVARFAFIGALAGVWLAQAEPASLRDLRVVDGSSGLWGWGIAVLALRWPALLAVAGAIGALSLHEIEASIFLQAPGLQSLSQTLLGYLHYSRLTELSAAMLWLVGGGLAIACVSALMFSRAIRPPQATEHR